MRPDPLRRASNQMRTAALEAQKQYASPWHDEVNEVIDPRGTTVAEVVEMGDINYLTEHIASWHPAVALAVADWLDDEAMSLGAWSQDEAKQEAANPEVFAVARAYLGESA